MHVSGLSHGPVAARHSVPAGLCALAGQTALVPLHVSAGSQAPSEARQVTPAALLPSAGQSLLVPEQTSAASQVACPAGAAGRQVTSGPNLTSGGQKSPPPQCSTRSQAPWEGPHSKVDGFLTSTQFALSPSHLSTSSQTALGAGVPHTVPAGLGVPGGRQIPTAQTLLSQPLTAPRQTAPSFAGG
jgi:hypothetical protein